MKYQAVIFDMDGLLLDSERIATETYIAAFRKFGIRADMPLYYRCLGTNKKATRQILAEGLGPDFPLMEFMKVWDAYYISAAIDKPVPLKDGAEKLLAHLDRHAIPCGVATSTSLQHATRKLANANILHFFDHLVAGDQVRQGKPDPEIYFCAASGLGVEAAACLALEDSDNGVRAAHGAGMTVFQIPDIAPPGDDVVAIGHKIVPSLHDILEHL